MVEFLFGVCAINPSDLVNVNSPICRSFPLNFGSLAIAWQLAISVNKDIAIAWHSLTANRLLGSKALYDKKSVLEGCSELRIR